jgi:hypothetical protein
VKHSVKAGYVRGEFWIPLDGDGSVRVYSGPPMNDAAAVDACQNHGDTAFWQEFNGV